MKNLNLELNNAIQNAKDVELICYAQRNPFFNLILITKRSVDQNLYFEIKAEELETSNKKVIKICEDEKQECETTLKNFGVSREKRKNHYHKIEEELGRFVELHKGEQSNQDQFNTDPEVAFFKEYNENYWAFDQQRENFERSRLKTETLMTENLLEARLSGVRREIETIEDNIYTESEYRAGFINLIERFNTINGLLYSLRGSHKIHRGLRTKDVHEKAVEIKTHTMDARTYWRELQSTIRAKLDSGTSIDDNTKGPGYHPSENLYTLYDLNTNPA